MFKVFRDNSRNTKYFTIEEQMETLSKTKPYVGANPKVKLEKRPIYQYKSEATYEGTWKGGMRQGVGFMQWVDGASYEGEWKDNKANGEGKFIYSDGDIYEGKWANDKANGFGIYLHLNGARYEGQWVNDA